MGCVDPELRLISLLIKHYLDDGEGVGVWFVGTTSSD